MWIDEVMTTAPALPRRNAVIALVVIGFGMMALAPLNGLMPLSYAAGPDPGGGGVERRGREGGCHRPHSLPAVRSGSAEMERRADGAWIRLRLLWRRRRPHQAHPRVLLGSSSISQMGVIAVALGAALVSADPDAPAKSLSMGRTTCS
jgi:hypothetical protein